MVSLSSKITRRADSGSLRHGAVGTRNVKLQQLLDWNILHIFAFAHYKFVLHNSPMVYISLHLIDERNEAQNKHNNLPQDV